MCQRVSISAEFQFHKGTIKTDPHTSSEGSSEYFNSIKVRLKQMLEVHLIATVRYFNSIKVRLKLMFLLLSSKIPIISIP